MILMNIRLACQFQVRVRSEKYASIEQIAYSFRFEENKVRTKLAAKLVVFDRI